jgi:DNA-binding phage protein
MIRALGRRVGEADPIDLQLILELRAEVDRAFLVALQGQVAAGFSHAEIAEGIGTSRQAVTKRLAVAPDVVA